MRETNVNLIDENVCAVRVCEMSQCVCVCVDVDV